MFSIHRGKSMGEMFRQNRESIREYNTKIYPKIALVGGAITGISFAASFVTVDMADARWMYGLMCALCCLLYVFSKVEKLRDLAVLWLYVEFGILYYLVLYLSVIMPPIRPAASMLIILAVFPITFIDKPWRLVAVDVGMYVLHTYLAYKVKGAELGSLDRINGFTATLVGCFLGVLILGIKLQALNLERLLVMEKETDVLTSIHNRRKLVETIDEIERKVCPMPNGVLMMDIDYFKNYNDTYGHATGDDCLRAFGKLLKEGEWGCQVEFYRYGGEEFVAFVWDVDESMLQSISELIREKTAALQLQHGSITLSVGYVYCDDESIINYDTWIERADMAVYAAKKNGRNCVVRYTK